MYKRVLLKLSGEVLLGKSDYGIDAAVVKRIGMEIRDAVAKGVEVALIVGGGNIFRGAEGVSETGMTRAVADGMGMLATMMNALALKDGFHHLGLPAVVLSAVPMGTLVDTFQRDRAIEHLMQKRVVIIPGGTSNPFFTTDTAAVLRALETDCEVILKGTKVDGVYSTDPKKDPSATRYETLSFDEAINKNLRVMDLSAFAMAKDHRIPIRVFNMTTAGMITKAISGEKIGTLVS